MNSKIRNAYLSELEGFAHSVASNSFAEAWSHLERAHILSQPFAVSHIYVHWLMFVMACGTRDLREMLGQIPRLILAGPGSLLGKAPVGNSGRSSIGIFSPMPIPEDLRRIISQGKSES